jgi:hypothetical protein
MHTMEQFQLQEKYPVLELEIAKTDTDLRSVEEIADHVRKKIADTGKAAFIGVFDHYAHTQGLGGEIAPGMSAAVNVVFCFGATLPAPRVLAVRPRSIGIADMGDAFVVNFMEAPTPAAQEAMTSWVEEVRRAPATN